MQVSLSHNVRWCGVFSAAALCEIDVYQVSRLIRENLTNRALRFNVVLDDVSITHVAFSPEFTHAVEAKQASDLVHLLFAKLILP
jgi:hypothetical protein